MPQRNRRIVLAAGVGLTLALAVAPMAVAAEYPPTGGAGTLDPGIGGVKIEDPAGVAGGGLPRTGGDALALGAAAIGLVGAGAVLVLVVRRRNDHAATS
ncbi:MAG: LPXTG cell wall anchor domain-containing protein [Caldilineaceae bacterium]